jgi:hypothetical protein
LQLIYILPFLGDLGTTAKEVESTLETNFALASRWGSILLLDEADVFLAQRTKEDFQRNGLVAGMWTLIFSICSSSFRGPSIDMGPFTVFLRVMEYYSGILFLTTNRVGDFDEAFASRIHISLYYPALGKTETTDVCNLNLQLIRRRFKQNRRDFQADDSKIAIFFHEYWTNNPFDRWNGRQIRNAFQTALALAEYEAQDKSHMAPLNPNLVIRLEVEHFKVVGRAYQDFSQHLQDIYGTHAARRAKESGLRALWVNDKGEVKGSVDQKEARIMRSERRLRFREKSHGRHSASPHAQQQQQQQVAFSRAQSAPYREWHRGMDPGAHQTYPASPEFVHHRPMQPEENYESPSTPQRYVDLGPRAGQYRDLERSPQVQGWGDGSEYEDGLPRHSGTGAGYVGYSQQHLQPGPYQPTPPGRGHPQSQPTRESQIDTPPSVVYSETRTEFHG